MTQFDTAFINDEQLLLNDVVCGDPELLFLDTLLRDIFQNV